MNIPTCYILVDKDNHPASNHHKYETEAAAIAALNEAYVRANERVRAAQFRAEVNQPHCTDTYDLKALDNLKAADYHPAKVSLTDTIYRLNTLPQESVQLVNEIVLILKYFPKAFLSWTCHGHTRAQWQGESAANFLNTHGFKAYSLDNGDVEISLCQ